MYGGMTPTWLLLAGLLAVSLLVHVTVAWWLTRGDAPTGLLDGDDTPGVDAASAESAVRGEPTPDDSPAPPLEESGDTVVCPGCGTENLADYRYCRWCVSPLGAGGASPTREGATSDRRPF